jgi:hypothetical protein
VRNIFLYDYRRVARRGRNRFPWERPLSAEPIAYVHPPSASSFSSFHSHYRLDVLGGNSRTASGSGITRSSGRNPPIIQNTRRATPADEPISPEKRLHNDCERVLDLLDTLGLNLGTLICLIFYGNPESRAPSITKAARAFFVQTDKLS